MSLIEPVQQKNSSSITKKYSRTLRLWHWANAIVISGSLITVLINSTILKPRKSAPEVLAEIQKDNPAFNLDQARTAVGFLEDKVWEWHVYFGFALTALLIIRLITEFFDLPERKFINQFKKTWHQFRSLQQERQAKHNLVVKSIYIVFYALIVIMVTTGLSLAFQDSLPFSKSLQLSVKEIHGFCMYLILAFIAVHLAGVFLAERKPDGKGLVSDMINGGN